MRAGASDYEQRQHHGVPDEIFAMIPAEEQQLNMCRLKMLHRVIGGVFLELNFYADYEVAEP